MARSTRYPHTEKTASGGFRASVRVDGKRIKGAVRVGPNAQRKAAEDALLMLERRTNGQESSVPTVTLEEALAAVLDRLQLDDARPATIAWTNSHVGWWIRRLGGETKLAEITREEVQQAVEDSRRGGAGAITIRHRLAALGRACRVCGVEPNPADRSKLVLPRARAADPATRVTWPDVVAALIALARSELWTELAVLGFVAGTGIRRTEFARMRQIDIDVRGQRIIVPVGKTHPRELPMPTTKGAGIVMRKLLSLNPPGPMLLPGEAERTRVNFLQQCIVKARAASNEPRLCLHGMRKAFASRVAALHPVPVVSALLGHALPGVTGLYVHADRGALTKAMADLWAEFEIDAPS